MTGLRRPVTGFTLVEVLVALFVMAVMAGLAWRGIDGIARTRDASQERLDAVLRIQTVMAQWEQDLAMLQDSGDPSTPPIFFDNATTLRLVRRGEQGLQVVAWSLRAGTLWRWASPVTTSRRELQALWQTSQQLMGNEPGQLRTLDGLARLEVFCWKGRPAALANCASSDDPAVVAPPPPPPASGAASGAAPAAPTQALPFTSGMRVVLVFAEGSGLAGSVTRELPVTIW